MKLELIPIEPSGKTVSLVMRSGRCTTDLVPSWTPTTQGRALRLYRTQSKLTLSDISKALDISPAEVGGLEEGRLNLNKKDWKRLLDGLRRVAERRRISAERRHQ